MQNPKYEYTVRETRVQCFSQVIQNVDLDFLKPLEIQLKCFATVPLIRLCSLLRVVDFQGKTSGFTGDTPVLYLDSNTEQVWECKHSITLLARSICYCL
jgi:hypothetical protein